MFPPPPYFLLLLLPFLPVPSSSLNILQLVPGFTNSHVLFNYRLASTLRALGHNVTLWTQMEMAMVFTGDFQLPPGVTEYRVPIHFRDRLKVEGLKVFQEMIFTRGTPYDLWWTGREFQEMRVEACEQMVEGTEAEAMRQRGPFDLAIGHFHDLCPVMLAARMGLDRLVWVTHGTSLYDFAAISLGLHTFPSFVPHPLSSNGHRMDFPGRLANVLWHLSGIQFVNLPESLLHIENKMYRKVFHGEGEADDLWTLTAQKVHVLLINGDRFLDFPRPLPQNIVFMGELALANPKSKRGKEGREAEKDEGPEKGREAEKDEGLCEGREAEKENGLGQGQELELEPDLVAVYSREGSKGVIVFSMGTVSNTSNMPPEMAQSFLRGFGKMSDYDFLWKTEQTELAGANQFPNVHLRRWIPQKKLLAHPKTRLLLAHGGYNSFLEASTAGMPVVLVPLFADQFINAERAKRFGIAETLDKMALSAEAVEGAVRRVLREPGYATNARRLCSMLADRPHPAPGMAQPTALRHSLKLAMAPRPELFALKAAQTLDFVQFHCIDQALALVGLIGWMSVETGH